MEPVPTTLQEKAPLPSPALSDQTQFAPPARTSSINLPSAPSALPPMPAATLSASPLNASLSPEAIGATQHARTSSTSSVDYSRNPSSPHLATPISPAVSQTGSVASQSQVTQVSQVSPIQPGQPGTVTVQGVPNGKPPTVAPVPKTNQTSSSSLLAKIFHLHDDDDHSQKKSTGSGVKSETGDLKKKDSLMDRLFHRNDRSLSATPTGSVSPDLRGATPPPDLTIQTAGMQASLLVPPMQPAVSPGSDSLTGYSLMREPYAASPAPDSAKNRASPTAQPAQSTGLQRNPSQSSTSSASNLKRSNSETIISSKYGEMETKVIGRGATSVVRLAHKKDDVNGPKGGPEKLFAVKEFRKRRKEESERDYIKKLTSEFCIGSSLHHPNVVDHLDLLQTPQGGWCEIMEYCAGGDLCTLIQNGGLTYDEANGFFAQLVNGVAYLHSLGVSHKDLKPENLMLDGRGSLKITDFGSAEVFRTVWEKEAHKSRRLAGSEPYIAPEEFTEKEFDPRAVDVWACGIIYLTMIYNRIPWRCATPSDPNYKFYIRCRMKHTHSSSQSLGGSATTLSPPASRENSSPGLTRSGSQSGLTRSASTSKSDATAFPMLDHLPAAPRQLVFRMLDPSPASRITIDEIRKDAWFRNIVRVHHGEEWMDRSEAETEKALAKKAGHPHGPSKLNPNPQASPLTPKPSTASPNVGLSPNPATSPNPALSPPQLASQPTSPSLLNPPSLATPPASLVASPHASSVDLSSTDLSKSVEQLSLQ